MFSLQPNDELVFETPTTSYNLQVCEIPQDLIVMDHQPAAAPSLTQTNFINFSAVRTSTSNSAGLTQKSDENTRKVVHREIERKRRKEMSNLHLTLASLLPVQQIKEKRPVCNQMQEAANYIKSMENQIEELKIRRDKLIKSSEVNKVVISSSGSDDDGMEILIKTDEDYGISRVLEELVEREVDVVDCVSTRLTTGFLHKIHIQGRNMKSLDVSMLQHKLTNAIN